MKIDWKLLADQKATLVDLISNGLLSEVQIEHLQGLVNFIDSEQDMAVERGVDKVVYLIGEDYLDSEGVHYVDGDGLILEPSRWKPGPNWRKLVRDVVDSADDTGCDGLTAIEVPVFTKLENAFSEVPS